MVGERYAGFEQGNRHVDGFESSPEASVVGDGFAYSHDGVGLAKRVSTRGAGERAMGTEGDGDGGADQIHDVRAGGFQRCVVEKLGGIISGRDDDIGVNFLDFLGKIAPQVGAGGDGVNGDSIAGEDDGAAVALVLGDAARGELFRKGGFLGGTETFDAGDYGDLVSTGGEGFHQQAVRLVAASMRGEVEGVVGEEDFHSSSFRQCLGLVSRTWRTALPPSLSRRLRCWASISLESL